MKTILTSAFISLFLIVGFANQPVPQLGAEEEVPLQRWSLELRAGMMNPISPFTADASTSLSSNLLNHLGFGFRYMFSDMMGVRVGGYLDNLKNASNSREFHSRFLTGTLQGIADVGKFLKLTSSESTFSLIGHLGIFIAKHDVLHDVPTPLPAGQPPKNATERDGGFKLGILPEFSLGQNLKLSFDASLDISFRRHMAWDGLSFDGEEINKLTGSKWNFSVGVVYSLN